LKAKPTEKTQVQTSSDTAAVEEEFSPEQRELLRFAAEGEYVFVKPIQYLKTELTSNYDYGPKRKEGLRG